jgi:peptide/nickel transport system substrate-binding protein
MMNRRAFSLRAAVLTGLVVVGLVALGTGAALSSSGSAKRASASVLVDGTTDTVVNLDPAGEYDYGSFTTSYPMFQGLLAYAPGGKKIVPVLATKCAFAGKKAYTCTLRKGVTFHNGDQLTSADVKFSFDRVTKIKDPSGIYTLLTNVASVTTNGTYGVTFHLKQPQAVFPAILTTSAGFIVDHTVYPADKVQPNTSTQVGTGPYQLVKFTPGQQTVFKAYDHYWGAKPKSDSLIIRYYSKSSTMKLALQKGDIDMAFRDFTPTEYAALGKTSGITVHKANGVVIRYLVLSVKDAPTNNPAVRQALSYLMPRQEIATRVYHGLVKPLYSMVPAGLPGHVDAFKTVYGATPSVTKAKAVLQKAGVTTPVPITIWWTPSHYGDASADEYAEIQRALNGSGLFKVTLKSAEWATYSKTLGTQYPAFQLGWFPDFVDAEDYVAPFYGTKSNFTGNGYSSHAMDALLSQEKAQFVPAKRYAILAKIQMLAAKDAPIIPYWQGSMIAVTRNNVHGITQTLDASFLMRFWLISKS